MENRRLQDNLRKQLTNVHALTVCMVSVIEVIGFLVLVLLKREAFSLDNPHLWFSVILPIAVNMTVHAIARRIVNRSALLRKKRTSFCCRLRSSRPS